MEPRTHRDTGSVGVLAGCAASVREIRNDVHREIILEVIHHRVIGQNRAIGRGHDDGQGNA